MSKVNVNESVLRYIAAWNERDAGRRRALVAATWTEEGSYVDPVRNARGHDAIDNEIARAQAHLPGYRVNLMSGIETHNGHVRFTWAAGGAPDAPLYLQGTDFGTLAEDGRFSSVVGFVDAMPARAA